MKTCVQKYNDMLMKNSSYPTQESRKFLRLCFSLMDNGIRNDINRQIENYEFSGGFSNVEFLEMYSKIHLKKYKEEFTENFKKGE